MTPSYARGPADRFQQQDLTMSRSERIRKRGRQPAEVFSEIATENEMMDTLGIAPSQVDSALGDSSADDRLLLLEMQVGDLTEEIESGKESKAG